MFTHIGFPAQVHFATPKYLDSYLRPTGLICSVCLCSLTNTERKSEAMPCLPDTGSSLHPNDRCGGMLALQRAHLFNLLKDGTLRTSDWVQSQSCIIACLAKAVWLVILCVIKHQYSVWQFCLHLKLQLSDKIRRYFKHRCSLLIPSELWEGERNTVSTFKGQVLRKLSPGIDHCT